MADDPRNEALAAEHAAVWTYGVLAARASASTQGALLRQLRRNHTAHVRARDTLLGAVAAASGSPALAQPSYPLPARLDSAEAIRVCARALETQCNDAAAWVTSQVSGQERLPFVQSLEAGALRLLALGGSAETFPGAADLDA